MSIAASPTTYVFIVIGLLLAVVAVLVTLMVAYLLQTFFSMALATGGSNDLMLMDIFWMVTSASEMGTFLTSGVAESASSLYQGVVAKLPLIVMLILLCFLAIAWTEYHDVYIKLAATIYRCFFAWLLYDMKFMSLANFVRYFYELGWPLASAVSGVMRHILRTIPIHTFLCAYDDLFKGIIQIALGLMEFVGALTTWMKDDYPETPIDLRPPIQSITTAICFTVDAVIDCLCEQLDFLAKILLTGWLDHHTTVALIADILGLLPDLLLIVGRTVVGINPGTIPGKTQPYGYFPSPYHMFDRMNRITINMALMADRMLYVIVSEITGVFDPTIFVPGSQGSVILGYEWFLFIGYLTNIYVEMWRLVYRLAITFIFFIFHSFMASWDNVCPAAARLFCDMREWRAVLNIGGNLTTPWAAAPTYGIIGAWVLSADNLAMLVSHLSSELAFMVRSLLVTVSAVLAVFINAPIRLILHLVDSEFRDLGYESFLTTPPATPDEYRSLHIQDADRSCDALGAKQPGNFFVWIQWECDREDGVRIALFDDAIIALLSSPGVLIARGVQTLGATFEFLLALLAYLLDALIQFLVNVNVIFVYGDGFVVFITRWRMYRVFWALYELGTNLGGAIRSLHYEIAGNHCKDTISYGERAFFCVLGYSFERIILLPRAILEQLHYVFAKLRSGHFALPNFLRAIDHLEEAVSNLITTILFIAPDVSMNGENYGLSFHQVVVDFIVPIPRFLSLALYVPNYIVATLGALIGDLVDHEYDGHPKAAVEAFGQWFADFVAYTCFGIDERACADPEESVAPGAIIAIGLFVDRLTGFGLIESANDEHVAVFGQITQAFCRVLSFLILFVEKIAITLISLIVSIIAALINVFFNSDGTGLGERIGALAKAITKFFVKMTEIAATFFINFFFGIIAAILPPPLGMIVKAVGQALTIGLCNLIQVFITVVVSVLNFFGAGLDDVDMNCPDSFDLKKRSTQTDTKHNASTNGGTATAAAATPPQSTREKFVHALAKADLGHGALQETIHAVVSRIALDDEDVHAQKAATRRPSSSRDGGRDGVRDFHQLRSESEEDEAVDYHRDTPAFRERVLRARRYFSKFKKQRPLKQRQHPLTGRLRSPRNTSVPSAMFEPFFRTLGVNMTAYSIEQGETCSYGICGQMMTAQAAIDGYNPVHPLEPDSYEAKLLRDELDEQREREPVKMSMDEAMRAVGELVDWDGDSTCDEIVHHLRDKDEDGAGLDSLGVLERATFRECVGKRLIGESAAAMPHMQWVPKDLFYNTLSMPRLALSGVRAANVYSQYYDDRRMPRSVVLSESYGRAWRAAGLDTSHLTEENYMNMLANDTMYDYFERSHADYRLVQALGGMFERVQYGFFDSARYSDRMADIARQALDENEDAFGASGLRKRPKHPYNVYEEIAKMSSADRREWLFRRPNFGVETPIATFGRGKRESFGQMAASYLNLHKNTFNMGMDADGIEVDATGTTRYQGYQRDPVPRKYGLRIIDMQNIWHHSLGVARNVIDVGDMMMRTDEAAKLWRATFNAGYAAPTAIKRAYNFFFSNDEENVELWRQGYERRDRRLLEENGIDVGAHGGSVWRATIARLNRLERVPVDEDDDEPFPPAGVYDDGTRSLYQAPRPLHRTTFNRWFDHTEAIAAHDQDPREHFRKRDISTTGSAVDAGDGGYNANGDRYQRRQWATFPEYEALMYSMSPQGASLLLENVSRATQVHTRKRAAPNTQGDGGSTGASSSSSSSSSSRNSRSRSLRPYEEFRRRVLGVHEVTRAEHDQNDWHRAWQDGSMWSRPGRYRWRIRPECPTRTTSSSQTKVNKEEEEEEEEEKEKATSTNGWKRTVTTVIGTETSRGGATGRGDGDDKVDAGGGTDGSERSLFERVKQAKEWSRVDALFAWFGVNTTEAWNRIAIPNSARAVRNREVLTSIWNIGEFLWTTRGGLYSPSSSDESPFYVERTDPTTNKARATTLVALASDAHRQGREHLFRRLGRLQEARRRYEALNRTHHPGALGALTLHEAWREGLLRRATEQEEEGGGGGDGYGASADIAPGTVVRLKVADDYVAKYTTDIMCKQTPVPICIGCELLNGLTVQIFLATQRIHLYADGVYPHLKQSFEEMRDYIGASSPRVCGGDGTRIIQWPSSISLGWNDTFFSVFGRNDGALEGFLDYFDRRIRPYLSPQPIWDNGIYAGNALWTSSSAALTGALEQTKRATYAMASAMASGVQGAGAVDKKRTTVVDGRSGRPYTTSSPTPSPPSSPQEQYIVNYAASEHEGDPTYVITNIFNASAIFGFMDGFNHFLRDDVDLSLQTTYDPETNTTLTAPTIDVDWGSASPPFRDPNGTVSDAPEYTLWSSLADIFFANYNYRCEERRMSLVHGLLLFGAGALFALMIYRALGTFLHPIVATIRSVVPMKFQIIALAALFFGLTYNLPVQNVLPLPVPVLPPCLAKDAVNLLVCDLIPKCPVIWAGLVDGPYGEANCYECPADFTVYNCKRDIGVRHGLDVIVLLFQWIVPSFLESIRTDWAGIGDTLASFVGLDLARYVDVDFEDVAVFDAHVSCVGVMAIPSIPTILLLVVFYTTVVSVLISFLAGFIGNVINLGLPTYLVVSSISQSLMQSMMFSTSDPLGGGAASDRQVPQKQAKPAVSKELRRRRRRQRRNIAQDTSVTIYPGGYEPSYPADGQDTDQGMPVMKDD